MDTYTGEDNYGAGVSLVREKSKIPDEFLTLGHLLNPLTAKGTMPTMVMLREKRVRIADIATYFITRDADDNAYLYIDRGNNGSYLVIKCESIDQSVEHLEKLDKLFGVMA